MIKARILFFALLIISVPLAAQKLSKTEKKIAKIVRANHEDAVAFLQQVVNTNSGTLNVEGVAAVGRDFQSEFTKLGFESQLIAMPDDMQRGPHLFAERKGNQGKRLLLIGHLDTVFEEDSPFQNYEEQDTIARGPGINDMKGGNVVILYALKALHEVGALDNLQIIVALHGDEEKPGKPLDISRRDIIAAGKRSDFALGFETATGLNYATVARRGSSGWRLEVTAKRAHSSGIFRDDVGAGAIFETSRILNAFYEEVRGEKHLSFNPGIIVGGTFTNFDGQQGQGDAFGKTNVVAQTATVDGGLRFISEEQKEKARQKMREIVAKPLPHATSKISFTDSYPAMKPTTANMDLLQQLDQVSQDLDMGRVLPFDPGRRGAADISFVAEYVGAGLDGLGTMGSGAHSPREYLDLRTFEALTARAAVFIYRLTR